MSFGLRDRDWVDPDEQPEPRLACSDCEHYRECCETCRAGWCMQLLEPTCGDYVACEDFETARP